MDWYTKSHCCHHRRQTSTFFWILRWCCRFITGCQCRPWLLSKMTHPKLGSTVCGRSFCSLILLAFICIQYSRLMLPSVVQQRWFESNRLDSSWLDLTDKHRFWSRQPNGLVWLLMPVHQLCYDWACAISRIVKRTEPNGRVYEREKLRTKAFLHLFVHLVSFFSSTFFSVFHSNFLAYI